MSSLTNLICPSCNSFLDKMYPTNYLIDYDGVCPICGMKTIKKCDETLDELKKGYLEEHI